jgi:cysteine desulfurase / selenocysteine lyase
MIYLDNAATSWPKPPEVIKAMTRALEQAGGNPGRSGHRLSIEAARLIYACREDLAEFFNLNEPSRVIFTPNATYAINLVLKGLLSPGATVITSPAEHNAVMRPLNYLQKSGIQVKIAPLAKDGQIDLSKLSDLMDNTTRLVVCNQANNVTGQLQKVNELGAVAHQKGAQLLVDAAQSAGVIPIDVVNDNIDYLAFTGHKELLGPTGSGGLVINPGVDIEKLASLVQGGTGSRSESEIQPEELPDKYEAGTANLAGIAGLGAGLKFIRKTGLSAINAQAIQMKKRLVEGLSVIEGVETYGVNDLMHSTAIVSFTIRHKKVSEIGWRLDEEYEILTRVGLHCAPAAHRTLGTAPEGTVRLSPGIFTTMLEIEKTLKAIQEIAGT